MASDREKEGRSSRVGSGRCGEREAKAALNDRVRTLRVLFLAMSVSMRKDGLAEVGMARA